ncbi:hypothetical protein X777_07546 [Ooceraea biroi]|uniref:Uncharacterized protein n=1 Tax=Ooceraea biroi TaxID=2015173 RepID=A0A026X368_OOCBI|nr:hypothetical protein X777_07546 [Ooceraea biroi]
MCRLVMLSPDQATHRGFRLLFGELEFDQSADNVLNAVLNLQFAIPIFNV